MNFNRQYPAKSNIRLSRILPPLLLLPLFVTPWDVTGLIYWMICAIAALHALFSLRHMSGHCAAWKEFLRPLLTVVIFAAAVAVGFAVEQASKRYAQNLAAQLQRACKEQGRCPAAPEGWQVQGKFARSGYGHWTFVYLTNAGRNEFGLWVHRRNENEICIHGGSTIELSEVRSLFCKGDTNVPSSAF